MPHPDDVDDELDEITPQGAAALGLGIFLLFFIARGGVQLMANALGERAGELLAEAEREA